MVEHIQQMAASSMHAVKLQQECQAIASSMHNVKMAQECLMAASSPPSDAPTPLPPPMPNIISRYCGNPITYLWILACVVYFDQRKGLHMPFAGRDIFFGAKTTFSVNLRHKMLENTKINLS